MSKATVIEQSDKKGVRTISPMSRDENGKELNLQERYGKMFNMIANKGKPESEWVTLSVEEIEAKRLELKKLAHALKKDIIDAEYAAGTRWSKIEPLDQKYYMILLENRAAAKKLDIHWCKRMWCARNIFGEVFKTTNSTKRSQKDAGKRNEVIPNVACCLMYKGFI